MSHKDDFQKVVALHHEIHHVLVSFRFFLVRSAGLLVNFTWDVPGS